MYYEDPARSQRLDILLHLIQYSQELLVLIGQQGIGKTMFLRQLIRQAGEHWKICRIDGHKMMNEEQFLQGVYTGFGIAHASAHKTTMLANLKKRLDYFLQQSLPVVLIIDDAHLFSNKILGLILEIASIKNPKTGQSVHAILVSEPQIKITLAEPELDEKHNLIIRKIDLPVLDELHTGNYLHHRLSRSGMSIEQFLTQPTISKIYRQSQGIPSKINEAADRMLYETTPIIRRTSNVHANQRKTALKYLVLILLALVTLGAFFYSDLLNMISKARDNTAVNLETVTPLTLPATPDTSPAADRAIMAQIPSNRNETAETTQVTPVTPAEPGETVESPADTAASAAPVTAPETAESASSPVEPEAAATVAEPAAPAAPASATKSADSPVEPEAAATVTKSAVTAAAAEASESVNSPVEAETAETVNTPAETTATAAALTPGAPVKPQAAQKSIPSQPALNDQNWILSQNPNDYTLQLVAGHQQKTIYNFIKKYQLTGGKISYFQTTRNGKTWHNLTFGVYSSRQLASAAVAELPGDLAQVKPWIRRLSSIQAEIKKSP